MASLPRLRLEACRFDGGVWRIAPEEARHLVKVRRCYSGSLVEGLLKDGSHITLRLECDGDEVSGRELSRESEASPAPRVLLLIALLKHNQFDDALRFSCETGAAEVCPLVCERSVPRYGKREAAQKTARWRKILDEAAKQSGAASPPVLREPVAFFDFDFDSLPEQRIAAMLSSGAARLRDIEIKSECAVAVGPEGDWSPREREKLLSENFTPVTLGTRVMRASTAAAVAVSAVAALYAK